MSVLCGGRAEAESAWSSGGYRLQSALRRTDRRGGGPTGVVSGVRECVETAMRGVYRVSVHGQSGVGEAGRAADSETVYVV